MRVLVTGASGFVGRRLVPGLEAAGFEVVAAVRRAEPGGRRVYAVGDIDAVTQWREALTDVDAVVHLAALVDDGYQSRGKPLAVFRRVNVAGTLNLARQAAAAGVRRFVFVSSVKVNGETSMPGRPFREDDMPAPQGAYAISKWEAEQGLRSLAAETGIEVVILRPPLIYGPGVKGNFARMIQWIARGVPLPFGAVRHNRRTLLALDNLVDFIGTCLVHPAAANQVFMVGDGQDLSTAELLHRLGRAMGKTVRLIPVPLRVLEGAAILSGKRAVMQRLCGSLQVSISKAQRVLGWTPPVSVDEGLRRTVQVLPSGLLTGMA